jgi:hypothetical protein
MSIINFDFNQQYDTRDNLPDYRSDEEKQNSLLSTYNHGSPDISFAERQAEEIVNISGAWIEIYPRTRSDRRDEVWEEDADPTYLAPKKLKGMFEPEPAEIEIKKWGVDVENETTVHFSRASVLRLFGRRMIAEGDVLIVPHNTLAVTQFTDLRQDKGNSIDTYRVIKSSDTGNFKYRWLYWSCLVQNISGDISLLPTKANQADG